jgi:hypothetical protein
MILLGLLAYVCLCVAIATVMPGAKPAAPKKAPPKTEPATVPKEWNGPALPIGDMPQGHDDTKPQLHLFRQTFEGDGDYLYVSGSVKNISKFRIDGVRALVYFKTASGQTVRYVIRPVDHNPMFPGQVSTFKVMIPAHPAIRLTNVTLSTVQSEGFWDTVLSSGASIRWKDKKGTVHPDGSVSHYATKYSQ